MTDFPKEWDDIVQVLTEFRLLQSSIAQPGGGKSLISQSIDSHFYSLGWEEKKFEVKIQIDDEIRESPTHKIDCFKNSVGVEIEWNNKDPFYDRDLNNFRLLFEMRALNAGVIITRCDDLQDIFDELDKGKSYGPSTTHMSKLLPRLEGGAGGGCPVLVFGISKALYKKDV